MSSSAAGVSKTREPATAQTSSRAMWIACGVGMMILVTAATAVHPLAGAGLLVAVTALRLVLVNPDLITGGFLFLMYSNAIVVAVRFHGVPEAAGKMVPGILLPPLVYHVLLKDRGIAIGASTPFVVLYAAVQLISTITSSDPVMAFPNLIEFLTEGLILYLLVLNLVRTEATLRLAVISLLLAGCLMGAVPIAQQISGNFDNNYAGFGQKDGDGDAEALARMEAMEARGEKIDHRLAGSIGEKNRFAQIMLMLIPLGILVTRSSGSRSWMLFGVIATLLAAGGAMMAFSRATIVAVAMVLIVAGFLRLVDRRRIALLGALAFSAMLLVPSYRERVITLVNIQGLVTDGKQSDADGALKGRATEMAAAALVFLDHPLTGVGPGMFNHHAEEYGERIGLKSLSGPRAAHCLPLDIAAETGILGFACVLMVFLVCSQQLLKARNCGHASQWMRAACTAFFVALLFYLTTSLFLHFAYIRYIWIVLALSQAAALITQQQHQQRLQQCFTTPNSATAGSRRFGRGLHDSAAGA